jgi:hypothetical protein
VNTVAALSPVQRCPRCGRILFPLNTRRLPAHKLPPSATPTRGRTREDGYTPLPYPNAPWCADPDRDIS